MPPPEEPHTARLDEEVDIRIFASQSSFRGPALAQLESIRASAALRNAQRGVHTALLYQSGWFVQWLEGPGPALQQLLAHVAQDPRHHHPRLLYASRGRRLLHEPWSMALVQTGEGPEAFGERVTALQAAPAPTPAAVWRLLTTPLTHPGATEQARSDRFQRVMVCSSRADASFALVDWLATQHHEPVVHRRFAGLVNQDVASDYADFVASGQVVRLIAMARHGIQLGLTRAFLPDYTHVALLLNGDAEQGLHLMQLLAQACRTLRQRPVVVGLGPDPQEHRHLFAAAHQEHLIYIDAALPESAGAEAQWRALQPLLR